MPVHYGQPRLKETDRYSQSRKNETLLNKKTKQINEERQRKQSSQLSRFQIDPVQLVPQTIPDIQKQISDKHIIPKASQCHVCFCWNVMPSWNAFFLSHKECSGSSAYCKEKQILTDYSDLKIQTSFACLLFLIIHPLLCFHFKHLVIPETWFTRSVKQFQELYLV